ncbi:MAG: HEAT repeat domain-containing protein [Defluviicoccus sp.]
MPATNTDQPIRLLHLSDLHFKAGTAWDADPVLRALAGFIEQEVRGGLVPDLVAITGDITFAGIAKEYALARKWLDNLWPKLGGLAPERLLLVPGNHDVDRSKVVRMAKLSQNDLLAKESQDEIAKVLSDGEEREVLLKRHASYLDFVATWLGAPQDLPWWQRVIEIRGCRVHVAGLDSAWMACGDEDHERLLIGHYQITQTVDAAGEPADDSQDPDWRIALLHHPWEDLAPFDRKKVRSIVRQKCDLSLRGHLHEPLSEYVIPTDPERGCLELATGCVYAGSDFPNAFQWVELSCPGKRVRIRFRMWKDNAWIVDRNPPSGPGGYADFELYAKTDSGKPFGATTRPLDVQLAAPAAGDNKWLLVIEAKLEEILPLVPKLQDLLRQLSGDSMLSIKRVSAGSVILELECSNKAGIKLHSLVADGELRELLGYRVRFIAIAPLIAALGDDDRDVRWRAAVALGKIGAQAVQPLIHSLRDERGVCKVAAIAVALGKMEAHAVQPLIHSLKDADWRVRKVAAIALALGKIGAGVQPLVDSLKADNADVRWGAAVALGAIRDARALQPLINSLKDDNADVRGMAAVGLGKLGHMLALFPLIDSLKDDNADVRRKAAVALGELGNELAVRPLIDALQDDSADVRGAACVVLRHLGHRLPPGSKKLQ